MTDVMMIETSAANAEDAAVEPSMASAPGDEFEVQLMSQLAERAQAEGLSLAGEGGLLARLTKIAVEAALEGEMDAHLGYAKHDPAGRDGGNSRNGSRAKTLLTEVGPVPIKVPRDRDASFAPVLVKKRQRRVGGVDEIVLSLSARGLTHGEISAHLADVYGAAVSKETISRITDRVLDGMAEWQSRPLDAVYPVIFIDAIHVKVRDGQVANRPIYVALGVSCDGERDILGLWAGEHGDGEGAKYWLRVLTEIKNRGVADVCMIVCDGLKGLPEAIAATWPQTITQTCVVHLLRNTFRYASKRDWAAIAKDLKPVYTAPNEAAALDRFAEFGEKWEARYPAIIKLWSDAWAEFVPSDPHPRTSRPVDLTHRRRLHPATPGPRPRRRRPPALATATSTHETHPGTRPPRISPTSRTPPHTHQPTKIENPRTRQADQHPTTTTNPLPSDQEDSLTSPPQVYCNRKLSRLSYSHALSADTTHDV